MRDWLSKHEITSVLLFLIAVVAGICLVVFLVAALAVRPISRHYDAASCHSFGKQSGRTVRFVDYTYWKWDCLTPSSDGKWISVKMLRDLTNDTP